MKERPILFSGPMVKAILEDRKTKTRRIVPVQPIGDDNWKLSRLIDSTGKADRKCIGKLHWVILDQKETTIIKKDDRYFKCKHGAVGDILWVRENWAYIDDDGSIVQYEADGEPLKKDTRWHPSIHMFRWMSRITLKIKNITIERLQDISYEDCVKEGVAQAFYSIAEHPHPWNDEKCFIVGEGYLKRWFRMLWSTINGPDSWNSNPYVFVIEFERIKP